MQNLEISGGAPLARVIATWCCANGDFVDLLDCCL